MIVLQPETPRWIREVERFIHIKSLLFVYGNILDLVSYPVEVKPGDIRWTESDLVGFFQRFLMDLNYDIVGVFDPLDGLVFASEAMEKHYTDFLNKEKQGSAWQRSKAKSGQGFANLEAVLQGIEVMLSNRQIACCFVFPWASRLLDAPDHLTTQERSIFTRLLKLSLVAKEVIQENQRWSNSLIFLCDKLNDLPPFLYLNNPRTRSIYLEKPHQQDRKRFFISNFRSFYGVSPKAFEVNQEQASLFSVLTEGLSYHEMMSLVGLSRREQIPVDKLQMLCDRFKYGITESAWDKIDVNRLKQAQGFIEQRIKGQVLAINRVLDIIKRAKIGLEASRGKSQRPKGVLFFAGPTGVGKTEMAKALASLLFGQEDRLIRFDMSEYASQNADQRLLGAPPGYLGYDEGGQLTNALKENPFSVLLFDEIEKADPSIFDKFLQILDDGRLTDGKGETVYFSESILIFTSNLGTVAVDEFGQRQSLVSPEMAYPQLQQNILQAIRDHFYSVLGRPEILNRFGDNFVVFDFIRPPVDQAIIDLLLRQLQRNLWDQYQLKLVMDGQVKQKLLSLAKPHLSFGGRGIRNMLDSQLINPLVAWLFDHSFEKNQTLVIQSMTETEMATQLDIKLLD